LQFGLTTAAAVLLLLPSNPRHPFGHGLSDRRFVDVQRGGNPHAAVRRSHPDVQVPDPLAVDVHFNVFQEERVTFFPFDVQPLSASNRRPFGEGCALAGYIGINLKEYPI